jgi:DNA-binding response OmpR family regulator
MAKIMIVDDNRDIVDTVKMIMDKEGYTTATAYNGQELIENVGNVKPDLVLLDVMMPGLTTKQILEKLKETGFGNLKVILVTVVRFSEDEKKSLFSNSKIVDYVPKPFDLDVLVTAVKNQVK